MTASPPRPARLYTIGHSTLGGDTLTALLAKHDVRQLVDVRTVPRSRHNPQFNRETLPKTLAKATINYQHMSALGGLRKPQANSPNGGWRNASFRGYADYMQTEAFTTALEALLALAEAAPTAVMCAEAVPWRCHRSLIADAALIRGIAVFHIMGPRKTDRHRLTSFAAVEGTRIIYPGATN